MERIKSVLVDTELGTKRELKETALLSLRDDI
jgi:hypothetical protein